jgi:hypothetical protein
VRKKTVEKFNIQIIGGKVYSHGLGETIDKRVDPEQIEDPELSILWRDAQIKMNEIQLYLEERLGTDFFL